MALSKSFIVLKALCIPRFTKLTALFKPRKYLIRDLNWPTSSLNYYCELFKLFKSPVVFTIILPNSSTAIVPSRNPCIKLSIIFDSEVLKFCFNSFNLTTIF
jgi:hypothetical protein